jgi:two-component system phosphate regulon response regulator PhoB
MQPSVLLVEDENDVVDLVRYHLNRAGFRVNTAASGPEGLRLAQELLPDIILLDLMLPGLDGYEVCRQLKANPETKSIGILMLTAKGETKDRVRGLELGADDYVGKPFSPRELVLRVESLHRRCQQQVQADTLSVDVFEVDRTNFTVKIEGKRLDVTTTEFKLITLLLERRGKILSREVLLADVWGYQNTVDTRTVDTHIRRLREKLGRHSRRIETLRGEGYRFLAQPLD